MYAFPCARGGLKPEGPCGQDDPDPICSEQGNTDNTVLRQGYPLHVALAYLEVGLRVGGGAGRDELHGKHNAAAYSLREIALGMGA